MKNNFLNIVNINIFHCSHNHKISGKGFSSLKLTRL